MNAGSTTSSPVSLKASVPIADINDNQSETNLEAGISIPPGPITSVIVIATVFVPAWRWERRRTITPSVAMTLIIAIFIPFPRLVTWWRKAAVWGALSSDRGLVPV
jgi:hypothetical protein